MSDTTRSARDMLADLAAKKISARELLQAHLARNDALHKKLNAVIETDIDRAMKDATAIDNARAKGTALGKLAGLPMTIKDGLDVENMPASSGAPGFHGRDKNCADADVVAATRRAGAVIWGKTNVPYMLGDIQSYNEIYGTTNNPYDVSRTPGGSSGGGGGGPCLRHHAARNRIGYRRLAAPSGEFLRRGFAQTNLGRAFVARPCSARAG